MKALGTLLAGIALICSPAIADARGFGGGGHGGGFARGAGGGFRGGYGGGYRGGYHGGYFRGGPYFYGAGLGFALGYYANPWFWDYPAYGSYYGYPAYLPIDQGPPPPAHGGYPDAGYANGAPPPAAAQAQQPCGKWEWGQSDRQYHWVTNGCN